MSKFSDFTNMAVASYISQAINFLPNHLAASVEKPVMNKTHATISLLSISKQPHLFEQQSFHDYKVNN